MVIKIKGLTRLKVYIHYQEVQRVTALLFLFIKIDTLNNSANEKPALIITTVLSKTIRKINTPLFSLAHSIRTSGVFKLAKEYATAK